jgi:high affinity Mn2+ porin
MCQKNNDQYNSNQHPRAPGFLFSLSVLSVLFSALLSPPAHAEESAEEAWNAHLQSTYVWQKKPSFDAPYSGARSLSTPTEKSYSFSATAALGWSAWNGGQIYLNPEVMQSVPLSNLTGLGGMTNGEQQKSGGPNPTLYRARFFLRQTWSLGGDNEALASDFNQLAGMLDRRRVVITVGNLAVTDIFDNNAFAHDARNQFLNWALTTHGAYDFASDARGYSEGVALEYYVDDWVVRAGRFMQPAVANALPLDRNVLKHYGDQIEIEHGHTVGGQAGKLRALMFRNRANMGGFRDALAATNNNGSVPDVMQVRTERKKVGFGISLEQNVSSDIGIFARASRSDGASETYAFAEIDHSLSAGAIVRGSAWQRSNDALGIALISNGLSQAHRDYLAAGGLGAFIGDGRLNYRPESILETYYSIGITKHAALTLDYQRIVNPAYNQDRGPVNVGTIRLHAQY